MHSVVCIYRSPSGSLDDFLNGLSSLLHEMSHTSGKIVFAGYFNVNFKNNNDVNAMAVNEIFSSYGLQSHICGDTRVTALSGSQIDNIFSNINNDNVNYSNIYTTNLSDHYGQIINIRNESTLNKSSIIQKRFFSDQNMILFSEHLSQETWLDIFITQGSDEKYTCFFNTFYYYLDRSFPVCTCRTRPNRKSWINSVMWYVGGFKIDIGF